MRFFCSRQHSTHQNLSDSSLFYRCQVIALINSCQNKFGLFDQFTWRKKTVGSAQSEEVYFRNNFNPTHCTQCLFFLILMYVVPSSSCSLRFPPKEEEGTYYVVA